MSIIDYDPHQRRYTFGDIFEEMFEGRYFFSPQSNNYTFRGQIVDTDRYDIVLKKEFVEKEIANKEDELKSVEETHRKELMKIQQEISVLKRALSPINPQNK